MEKIVIGGIYKHYKGHIYKVTGLATHSETLEELVLYQLAKGKDTKVWARPKIMFAEKVTVEGKKVLRFLFIPQK